MRDDFPLKTKELLAKRVGGRCSNPSCERATSGPKKDPAGSINIGVAAHITAASRGGPRFNSALDDEQRTDYENGIWLCQNCAKLVDSDAVKYTVDQLRRWKQEAEASAQQALEHPGARGTGQIYVDSVVSINQSGGQVAKTIINPKPAPRLLASHDRRLIGRLSSLPPLEYILHLLSGDSEARNLADELNAVLKNAGWVKKNVLTHLSGSFSPGIILYRNCESDGSQALLEALVGAGLKVSGQAEFKGEEVNIYIGPHPELFP